MHAFIVVSRDFDPVLQKAQELTGAKWILPYKIEKIDDTRQLIKITNTSVPAKTCYVLEHFENASIEAQNSFLKRLEEPQKNLSFVLHVKNEESVLPTISSRCQLIRLNDSSDTPDASLIGNFVEANQSEKLKIISSLNKREDAVAFLKSLITQIHKDLATHPENAKLLAEADEALSRLNKNANSTLQLTRLILAISNA